MAELTVAAYLPTPLSFPLNIQTVTTSAVVFTYDLDAGTYTLAGSTTVIGGAPYRSRVVLIEQISGRVIREVWSDAAGNYAFTGIAGGRKYTVAAFDHNGLYRAVIADNLLPTP